MKRDVVSILSTTTIHDAAKMVVERHVGLLPVVNEHTKLVGVVSMQMLLTLEMPDFVNMIPNVDFVLDFGAVETTRPEPSILNRPVSTLMQPVFSVDEDCGLLRAYALMLQRRLLDLPVVGKDGRLIGLASRVDIGAAILSIW